jgi:hypothetical protein
MKNRTKKDLEARLSWLSSFYDIYQKINEDSLEHLDKVYIDYLNEWDLPQLSCDELICEILPILND